MTPFRILPSALLSSYSFFLTSLNSFYLSGYLKYTSPKLSLSSLTPKSQSCVLVSSCHCNKLPQTPCLKTTDICSLIFLEARNLKSISLGWSQGVSKAMLHMEALGKNPFLVASSFWWLHSLACGCITPISSSMDALPLALY